MVAGAATDNLSSVVLQYKYECLMDVFVAFENGNLRLTLQPRLRQREKLMDNPDLWGILKQGSKLQQTKFDYQSLRMTAKDGITC